MKIKIASWNINSIRKRLNEIRLFNELEKPDVLCLQETKVHDDEFPEEEVRRIGFHYIYYSGNKANYGVAFLSKIPLTNIEKIALTKSEQDHGRHIKGVIFDKVVLHNFYVPSGGSGEDESNLYNNPKFVFKLNYCKNLVKFLQKQVSDKIIVVGDLNIAPLENDVWSHKQLFGIISHTNDEIKLFNECLLQGNLVDVGRRFIDESQKLYSWWSYRNKDWKKSNRGRRLDHILVSKNLEKNLKSFKILSEARDFYSPSDHVPVIMEIDI